MNRHDLTDADWPIIEPLLPDTPRGVPRVDDRLVINGIIRRFRTGCCPERRRLKLKQSEQRISLQDIDLTKILFPTAIPV